MQTESLVNVKIETDDWKLQNSQEVIYHLQQDQNGKISVEEINAQINFSLSQEQGKIVTFRIKVKSAKLAKGVFYKVTKMADGNLQVEEIQNPPPAMQLS